MAATFTINQLQVPGATHVAFVDFTGDSSYPTGGYAVTPQTFGFTTQIYDVIANDAAGYNVRYDNVNNKVMLYDTGASSGAVLAETANTTNVSAITSRLIAFGV